MKREYTEEQRKAIAARGRVIVSASAGSGKTFVMIERLVSLILEGHDVRRILAVTFTNKAAAQIRERLRSALLGKIAQATAEEKARIKLQLAALPMAEISTLHAYCGRLVRSYFYLAGVNPTFRIVSPDDAECKRLSRRALDEAFERGYESGGAQFAELLSAYFKRKKDAGLRQIVLSLYEKCRGFVDYRERLSAAGEADFDGACAYLLQEYGTRAEGLIAEAEELASFFEGQNVRALAVVNDVRAAAEAVTACRSLFEATALTRKMPLKISVMPSSARAEGEALRRLRRASALSAAVKELYKEIAKTEDEETERTRFQDACARAKALAALALEYDGIYGRLKTEANVLDYDDLEHFALKVLDAEEARRAVREGLDFVFVDEYQDVNPAQEELLNKLGGDEAFLVGDVKQSIYGFRGSKSVYFTQKAASFPAALALTENFRSAPAVLEGVNRIFFRAMTPETCGFNYVPMVGGRRFEGHAGSVLFHRVAEEKGERAAPKSVYSVQGASVKQSESAVAERIAQIVADEIGTEWFDADAGLVKRVGFGDIAVLVRKKTGTAEKIVAALTAREIPVSTASKENACDGWEARLLIDWLSYLDNAEQDIPLASAMLSSIGGFTEADLTAIRLAAKEETFRAACKFYADGKAEGLDASLCEKLRVFYKRAEGFRTLSRVRTAAEMMDLLLSEGLEAEIAAKKGGGRRLLRVRRLIQFAQGNIREFLASLKAADYFVEFSEGGGEDAVKVVTMHASKGLEYPVVILADLDVSFHGADRDETMFTDRFFIAPKSFDYEKRLVYETVLRRAAALWQESEEVKEELNLLYVAMTRARYRLHMLFGDRASALSPRYAKRLSDFVGSDCDGYYVEDAPLEAPFAERRALVYRPQSQLTQQILSVYRKPYPFEESTRLPVKDSATGLMKRLASDVRVPFTATGAESSAGSAEEGTAYHAFLQYVRFGEDAEKELARLTEEGLLPPEQAAVLQTERLQEILDMPCFVRLKNKRLFREQKFLVKLPANEILDISAADEIVCQGAIDLLFRDGDGYFLYDYKYSGLEDEALREKYAVQIALYRKAVARAMRAEERTVRAQIVNIKRLRVIEM